MYISFLLFIGQTLTQVWRMKSVLRIYIFPLNLLSCIQKALKNIQTKFHWDLMKHKHFIEVSNICPTITLRTSLRQHSYWTNIINSPQCVCDSIEDTHHYLFVYHKFANLSRELLNSVSDICHHNLNVLLNGDPSLSSDQNKKIFQAVQDFIMKTKRFEWYIIHL